MIIKELNRVNDELIREVSKVQAVCNEHDKLQGEIEFDTSLNFNKDMKSIFLLYEDKKLVSVLSIFAPTSNEGEITAVTLPEYRQRGYFKKLYEKAVEELKNYNVKDVLFVCESESTIGKEVITKLQGKYEFTEYSMKYCNEATEDINSIYNTKLRIATNEDLEELICMSQSIFNDEYADAKSMIEGSFASEARVQYIAIFDNKPVGSATVFSDKEQSTIYALGILPEYQGKGIGREFLTLLLKEPLKDKQNIRLEVNSVNARAFNLYKSMNFKVEVAFDYYRKSIN